MIKTSNIYNSAFVKNLVSCYFSFYSYLDNAGPTGNIYTPSLGHDHLQQGCHNQIACLSRHMLCPCSSLPR